MPFTAISDFFCNHLTYILKRLKLLLETNLHSQHERMRYFYNINLKGTGISKVNSLKKKTKKANTSNRNQQTQSSKPSVLLIAGIIFFVVITGVILYDNLRVQTAMTIDGENYTLDDIKYYFYIVESSAAETEELYKQIFGVNYWDTPYDEATGVTMGDVTKSQLIDMALKYEVLSKEAESSGHTLSEEDEETIAKEIDKVLKEDLNEEDLKRIGFTEEYVKDFIRKMTLADSFQESIVNTFEIDKESIRKSFDFEDYRQYDISYIWVSTDTTDEDGEKIELSDSELKELYDKLDSVYSQAKTESDWSKLLDEDEKDLKFKELGLIEGKGNFTEDLEKEIMSLKTGEISEILEDEKGYYFIRMDDSESREHHESTIDTSIQSEIDKRFEEHFEIILDDYDYNINLEYLRYIKLGTVTKK